MDIGYCKEENDKNCSLYSGTIYYSIKSNALSTNYIDLAEEIKKYAYSEFNITFDWDFDKEEIEKIIKDYNKKIVN